MQGINGRECGQLVRGYTSEESDTSSLSNQQEGGLLTPAPYASDGLSGAALWFCE